LLFHGGDEIVRILGRQPELGNLGIAVLRDADGEHIELGLNHERAGRARIGGGHHRTAAAGPNHSNRGRSGNAVAAFRKDLYLGILRNRIRVSVVANKFEFGSRTVGRQPDLSYAHAIPGGKS